MNITQLVTSTHATVWEYRKRLSDVWPTPGRIDALRFAYTEAGEAMDAYLRTVPQYRRNNARNISVEEELADCAMMLCTALPETYRFPAKLEPPPTRTTLDGICFAVAEAMLTGDVLAPLVMIAAYMESDYGASLPVWVRYRLARIEQKVTAA